MTRYHPPGAPDASSWRVGQGRMSATPASAGHTQPGSNRNLEQPKEAAAMQPTRTCSIDGCEKPVKCRGWCHMHYSRWQRHGDPLIVKASREKRPCSVDGCDRPAKALGLCHAHWVRMRQHGSVQADNPVRTVLRGGSIEDRFWPFVDNAGDDECWMWTRAIQPNGYGVVNWNGSCLLAHRVSYTLTHGTIPDGMEIDHRCGNRACVNPTHLRAVDRLSNCQNRMRLQSNNTSGYPGVSFDRRTGQWKAYASMSGKWISLGRHDTAGQAAEAARRYREEHYDLDRI